MKNRQLQEDGDEISGNDDEDYVPPPPSGHDSDDERSSKRRRGDCDSDSIPQAAEDEGSNKASRDTLWASFQASISTPDPASTPAQPPRMVKIEKRYRFAGKDVIEIKEVPEDCEDAKKWPLYRDPQLSPSKTDITATSSSSAGSTSTSAVAVLPSIAFSPNEDSAAPGKSTTRRPGPRKSKLSLSSLPTPGSSKAKKLTTLDKSAMDWQAHINSADDPKLQDTLEANRRGGGYLDKVDFLQRVEERKNEALDTSKSGKRRRV